VSLSLLLVVSSSRIDHSQDNVDQERLSRCRDVTARFNTCTKGAHESYVAKLENDDGRPNFQARKACNYLMEGVQECSDILYGECNTDQRVEEMKEFQTKSILQIIESTIPDWDSSKCPAIKKEMGGPEATTDEGEDGEGGEGGDGGEGNENAKDNEGEDKSEDQEGSDPEVNVVPGGVSGLKVIPALLMVAMFLFFL